MAVDVDVKGKRSQKKGKPNLVKNTNINSEIIKYIDRIGMLLSRPVDPDSVREPLQQLLRIIPGPQEKGSIDVATGIAANRLLEARMRIGSVLLKIDGERPDPSKKFDPNPVSGVRDCYRTLVSIFIPPKPRAEAPWVPPNILRKACLSAPPRRSGL